MAINFLCSVDKYNFLLSTFSQLSFQLRINFGTELTGNVLFEDIQAYLNEADLETGWPSWEMNDHENVKGFLMIF